MEAIEWQAPVSAHGPLEVMYKAPPPVSVAYDAGTQPEMLQGLTHANHPIPSTPYNAPPARSPAAQTHQEQLAAAQMGQISQCSFTGNQITHPGVMNHQAHLIPTISNVCAAKAGTTPPPPPINSPLASAAQDGGRPSVPPPPPRPAQYPAGAGLPPGSAGAGNPAVKHT